MSTTKKILIGLGLVVALCVAQVLTTAHAAPILQPPGGGLGTNVVPASGTIPIGNGAGTYTPATLTPGTNVTIVNASGSITINSSGGGGGSSTVLNAGTGWNVTALSGGNQTGSLDTTYAASWSTLETFLKGATINGTTTLASTTNALLLTNGSGTVLGYAGSNPCGAGFAAVSLSATGTIGCTAVVTSTAGNWAGTWQGVNSSTFYLASNPSSYLTGNQTISLTGPVTGSGATTIATTLTSPIIISVIDATTINVTSTLTVLATSTITGNVVGGANATWNSGTVTANNFVDNNATSTQCDRIDPITGILESQNCVVSLNNLTGNVIATGTTNQIAFSSSTGNLVASIPTGFAGPYMGFTGGAITASSTLASSTVSFIFDNASTTKPYSFQDILTNTAKTIAYVDCYEYAAATSTMELYYNTTNASTGIQQVILPSIACGLTGATSTSFTTTTLPINAYLFAIVSSTVGTPQQTTLNVSAFKL